MCLHTRCCCCQHRGRFSLLQWAFVLSACSARERTAVACGRAPSIKVEMKPESKAAAKSEGQESSSLESTNAFDCRPCAPGGNTYEWRGATMSFTTTLAPGCRQLEPFSVRKHLLRHLDGVPAQLLTVMHASTSSPSFVTGVRPLLEHERVRSLPHCCPAFPHSTKFSQNTVTHTHNAERSRV